MRHGAGRSQPFGVLLEYGANPAEPDLEGSTAIELADWWVGKDVEGELVARVELLVGTLEHGRRGGEISVDADAARRRHRARLGARVLPRR